MVAHYPVYGIFSPTVKLWLLLAIPELAANNTFKDPVLENQEVRRIYIHYFSFWKITTHFDELHIIVDSQYKAQ